MFRDLLPLIANFQRSWLSVAALAALLACGRAEAQLNLSKPEALEGVGVDEQLGKQIPLDLAFRDDAGNIVKLADIFNGDRPVLLSLNYSNCPMLCGLQLNGLTAGLRELEWNAGDEYTVVSVSVDPLETTTRAKQTKQRYLELYGRPGVGSGWRFLVGSQENITKLADAVGFRYRFVPETREYAHSAVEIVCTPDGVVSRYLGGIQYEPKDLKLSLIEAGEGQIGSHIEQFIMSCYYYDPNSKSYVIQARRVMQLGGLATMLAIAIGIAPYWRRRKFNTENTEEIAERNTEEENG
jgi:protein SCO1